ncbi:hypothetical protein [Bdellovibrio sp. HCB337]|uniref:hypothetical protein n=1 Tax=Bdellovibrio sp. HCB337 TaxID=3394358 RepID=UPI0039A57851
MHSTKNFTSLTIALGALTLVLSFQNCAKAKFETDSSSAVLKSGSQGDDVSLTVPLPSSPGDDSNTSSPAPSPTPKNTTTTTIVTTGGGGTCPAFGSTGPTTSINVSTGNNTQSNNIGMKAMGSLRAPVVSKCATIDMTDVKLMLEQLVVKKDGSQIVVGNLSGQYLTRENSISFIAGASVSDVESVLLVLQKSGHQFMTSKSEVKSMGLKDLNKKKLTLQLSQKTSFEKGRSYTLHLQVTESSSLVEDGSQCLLKPVLDVQ